MNEDLFNGKTEYYEKSRPSVSRKAVDFLFSAVSSDAVFADIGAGTGKFTSLIAERGNAVYAVEPNEQMYAVLAKKLGRCSNVTLLNKSAEETGIPSESVDVVTVVTALHWFDLDQFRKECLRILKPGGFVAVIYNSRKSELAKKAKNPSEKTATEIFFKDKQIEMEFPNPMLYSRDQFVSYHLSHASAPNPQDENYPLYLEKIISTFEENCENDRYLFDFVSVVYFDRDFIKNHSHVLLDPSRISEEKAEEKKE